MNNARLIGWREQPTPEANPPTSNTFLDLLLRVLLVDFNDRSGASIGDLHTLVQVNNDGDDGRLAQSEDHTLKHRPFNQ